MTLPPSYADALPPGERDRLVKNFPLRLVDVGAGLQVGVREAGAGDRVLLCLHGIGSGAASWLDLAEALPSGIRLIAWDAPGYGKSSALESPSPDAMDYAWRLDRLVRSLGLRDFILVGHSLGALPAAAYARHIENGRVQALLLLSPATGYGGPGRQVRRAAVRAERLAQLDRDGIAAMAAARSERLVSPHASARHRAWVRWNMAQLNDGGYRQAIELLCEDELPAYLPPPRGMSTTVACGDLDVVTTPTDCNAIAVACGQPLQRIAHAGHACYVEQPQAILTLLKSMLGPANVGGASHFQEHS